MTNVINLASHPRAAAVRTHTRRLGSGAAALLGRIRNQRRMNQEEVVGAVQEAQREVTAAQARREARERSVDVALTKAEGRCDQANLAFDAALAARADQASKERAKAARFMPTLSDDAMAGERARLAKVKEGHWTGSKCVRGRDIKEVAKDVRKDLRAKFKGCKFSVRISRYSMGQSLDIEIKKWPAGVEKRDRVFAKAVEDVANAYNFDKSDTMTDYFSMEFGLQVSWIYVPEN